MCGLVYVLDKIPSDTSPTAPPTARLRRTLPRGTYERPRRTVPAMSLIDQRLAAAAARGPDAYFATVIEQTRSLHERFHSQSELTATLSESDTKRLRSLLSVSLVLNDRTAVHYLGQKKIQVSIPQPDQYKAMFGVDKIRFNVTEEHFERHKIDRNQPSLAPCFFYSPAKELAPLLNALMPCIERGRVTFQPVRGILTKQDRGAGAEGDWNIIGVEDKGTLELWEPEDGSGVKPTPLVMAHASPVGQTLFEVTMPFLQGIPFRELDSMLLNEADIVSAFRASLKAAVREAGKNGTRVHEIIGDIVKPRVGVLERKMKSLQRVHGIKVAGAALGSVALAFTAASTGGVGAGLLAIASAGGFGVLANQYADYLGKRDELSQDPYYFLWKCKQVANATKQR